MVPCEYIELVESNNHGVGYVKRNIIAFNLQNAFKWNQLT